MPISVLPAPCTISALVQFGHPAAQYIRKVRSGEVLTNIDYVLFTTYFVICAIWMFLESILLWALVEYCPLFLEAKILFFWWLASPEYKGAVYLWYAHIKPMHKILDEKYYDSFMTAVQKAALPEVPAAETSSGDVSDKEKVIRDMLEKKGS
ncbi:unnamed protein product [Durusdinium trenchii]|uniref:Uncharacterized protein T19C3.4 n=2 Tax=Durusdinium trenchii TaxID=1381693 RepID=A0ABP0M5M4_9DINO